jgi:hypothetical protein
MKHHIMEHYPFRMHPPGLLCLGLLALIGFGVGLAEAQVVIKGTNIDSALISGSGNLQSITVGATTYSTLTAPNSILDNKASLDVIHTGTSAPANLAAAIGSMDLTVGALNADFEAQFTSLSDTTLFYLLVNNNDASPNSSTLVYALDSAGNRLGGISGTLTFINNVAVPTLVVATTYNRTTGGAANGTLPRIVSGVTFTLTDLGLNGLGATGIEFADNPLNTNDLDPQAFGIVQAGTSTAAPRITSFENVSGSVWELALAGDPGTLYEFRTSTTLDFNPGTLVENLTQGSPGSDPGTIGGINNSQVTTDLTGAAKVRMLLTGNPADFVRAQTVP